MVYLLPYLMEPYLRMFKVFVIVRVRALFSYPPTLPGLDDCSLRGMVGHCLVGCPPQVFFFFFVVVFCCLPLCFVFFVFFSGAHHYYGLSAARTAYTQGDTARLTVQFFALFSGLTSPCLVASLSGAVWLWATPSCSMSHG